MLFNPVANSDSRASSVGLQKRISFVTEARLEIFDEELILELKRAGCRALMFGIESGDVAVEVAQSHAREDMEIVALSSTYRGVPIEGGEVVQVRVQRLAECQRVLGRLHVPP